MLEQVWKFPLELRDHAEVSMPEGAKVLMIGEQNGVVWIWALVDPTKPYEGRTFRVAGTGHELGRIPDDAEHLGSVILQDGLLVFHVFGRRS